MITKILLNTIKQNRREITFLKSQIGEFIMDIEQKNNIIENITFDLEMLKAEVRNGKM